MNRVATSQHFIPAVLFDFAAALRKALVALLIIGFTALAVAALGAGTASAQTAPTDGAQTEQIDGSFPNCPQLHEGDSGPCVTKLEAELNWVQPKYKLDENDDHFGPAVRKALLDFQGSNHLGADGTFGPITAAELQRQFDATGYSVPTPNPADQTDGTDQTQATGPNAECLNQHKVRDTSTGECIPDGVKPVWWP